MCFVYILTRWDSDFISLLYIAFVKPFTPGDACLRRPKSGEIDCMYELESQFSSLVITRATVQQILEVGLPFIVLRIRNFRRRRQSERLAATPLLSDVLDSDSAAVQSEMHANTTTVQDYGEMVIQHGYLVMFGMAFPFAALINLANNIIESRTDLYKMLMTQQRSGSDDSADIGGWLGIIQFLSTMSVITTAGLVTITTPALQRLLPRALGSRAEQYPATSFVVFEHVLLGIRWAVAGAVRDTPDSTHRLLARQQFLIAKCFNEGWKPWFRKREERKEEGMP